MPPVYRERAIFDTDGWEASAKVLPAERHAAVGKETGLTS